MGDLILTEVLQGFQNTERIQHRKGSAPEHAVYGDGGPGDCSKECKRITGLQKKKASRVRKTMHVLIGTFCIHYQLPLLHDDRDFEPMVHILGLKTVDT